MKEESAETTWRSIRGLLEARQAWIVGAVRDYPPPITGCDAQFDHLRKQRDGISRALKRLEQACQEGGGTGNDIAAFITSSNWIEGDAVLLPAHTAKATAKRIET